MTGVALQVPLVDYLALGDEPHLIANECVDCGHGTSTAAMPAPAAVERRSGRVSLATTDCPRDLHDRLRVGPGIPVPFIAGVVDCDGTKVRANVVNVAADPEHVTTGMALQLTTFPIGRDSTGAEAITFGFEPATL